MTLSAKAITAIKTASSFTVFSDAPSGAESVYFVVAHQGESKTVLTTDEGHRWQCASQGNAREPVLHLRPELSPHDLYAGYVPYGPYASDNGQQD